MPSVPRPGFPGEKPPLSGKALGLSREQGEVRGTEPRGALPPAGSSHRREGRVRPRLPCLAQQARADPARLSSSVMHMLKQSAGKGWKTSKMGEGAGYARVPTASGLQYLPHQ